MVMFLYYFAATNKEKEWFDIHTAKTTIHDSNKKICPSLNIEKRCRKSHNEINLKKTTYEKKLFQVI